MERKDRKSGVLRNIFGITVFFCLLLLPSYTGLSWSSTELSGYFTTHQFLTRAAYTYLQKHPMIDSGFVKFPVLSEIEKYEGVNINLKTGLQIQGEGPDNPKNSKYADHYFNPSLPGGGAGNAPSVISEYYTKLLNSLFTLSDPENIPARNAAYLAHYIQDMSCPFHVIGTPESNLSYNPAATGPYIKKYGAGIWEIEPLGIEDICFSPQKLIERSFKYKTLAPEDFWTLMVERYRQETSQGANWFEPNYYDGPDCEKLYTYLSTHFIYETVITPFHNSVDDINYYSSMADMNVFDKSWIELPGEPSKKANEFAKLIANNTKAFVEENLEEIMFDPQNMGLNNLPYILLAATNIGEENKIPNLTADRIKDYVPKPDLMWFQAIQSTYTLWRATFSGLYINFNQDIKLIRVGVNPDKYIAKVRVRNYEPEDVAENVSAKLMYNLKVRNGVFNEPASEIINLGEARFGTVEKISDWITIKEPFTFGDDLTSLMGVEITGTYKNIPDAGYTIYAGKDYNIDPLGGKWYIEEAQAEATILFDPVKNSYECKLLTLGDYLFYVPGETIITGIKQGPFLHKIPVNEKTGGISYNGTELSYELLEPAPGVYNKGNRTRQPLSISVNGDKLFFVTNEDVFHFTRIKD